MLKLNPALAVAERKFEARSSVSLARSVRFVSCVYSSGLNACKIEKRVD